MLSFVLLCLLVGRGGDGSNFMDTDHLSSSDDVTDTINGNNVILRKPSNTEVVSAMGFCGLWCLRPIDTGIWHEGKLLAKHIFH